MSGSGSLSPERRGKLGTIVRRFRLMRGMTQTDVTAVTGKASNLIGNLESGRVMPSAHTIGKVCQALDIPPGLIVQLACWDELSDREKDAVEDMCDKILLDPNWNAKPKPPTPEQAARWEQA